MFCINIIDDKDLEEDETFTLTINDTKSDHNHVILTDPYMVHVTIIDDECKYLDSTLRKKMNLFIFTTEV